MLHTGVQLVSHVEYEKQIKCVFPLTMVNSMCAISAIKRSVIFENMDTDSRTDEVQRIIGD